MVKVMAVLKPDKQGLAREGMMAYNSSILNTTIHLKNIHNLSAVCVMALIYCCPDKGKSHYKYTISVFFPAYHTL